MKHTNMTNPMQKTKYILLAVALLLPVAIHAQSFEGLWATGSALDGGIVQLTKRPDGLFRFAGALKAGELKIMTTETFVQGTTQFLKPSYVDSYLINHGLRYGLTKDESQEGWVVSFQEDTYRFLVDPVNRTLTGELMLPWNEVLIAGSAFLGGSNSVEWDRNAMLPFTRDHDQPYVFTWTGELGVYSDVVEPGRFKLEGQMTWGPRELHPYVQDEDILQASQMRTGGDDTKWRVSQNGTYRITVNLFTETIHAELLNLPGTTSPTAVRATEDRRQSGEVVSVYDLSGRPLDKPRKGINLMRMADGSVRKVICKE